MRTGNLSRQYLRGDIHADPAFPRFRSAANQVHKQGNFGFPAHSRPAARAGCHGRFT
ncbi:hypothetical protein FRACA_2100008 [Frankia canadensis]|uniref:Uncharacterized protein n=1 Tax=Frankia canadensis TaxID=1836972 RepID=A0A2I2KQM0_9ACTN|nr:hypothetical protein FRACA_2100008 [Frankia canadensis]SOU55255.1 hypothetical protein FRACA_2100008 [Frankia canadensis]